MAALSPTANIDPGMGQGIFKIVKFASVNSGDTWTGPKGCPAYWFAETSQQSTQTSGGMNVSYVSTTGVFTFKPSENGISATLFFVTGG